MAVRILLIGFRMRRSKTFYSSYDHVLIPSEDHAVIPSFPVFHAGHSLCSTQDIPCVPSRTFLVFETRISLCSKQDIPCVRSRTFFVFEAGHSLCSKQDIACVANKRFRVFQSPTMHMPLFGEFSQSSQDLGES